MKVKSLILLLCILLITAWASAQDTASPALDLSPEGKKAFDVLLTAKRFEDKHVGYGGDLSKYVEAYLEVLKEPNRAAALKTLLEKASKSGQLYGLTGLYDADHAFFLTAVERYERDSFQVDTLSGCIGEARRVSDIVFDDKPNTVRFEDQYQTFKEWKFKAKITDGFMIDIAGGGYSWMFRGYDLVRPK